jgi:hypothetical protein
VNRTLLGKWQSAAVFLPCRPLSHGRATALFIEINNQHYRQQLVFIDLADSYSTQSRISDSVAP